MATRELLLGLLGLNLGLAFVIVAHRIWRKRLLLHEEERRLRWALVFEEILRQGTVSRRVPAWQAEWDRRAADEALLERWDRSAYDERELLKAVFRVWGLFGERRRQLRHADSWTRARSALVLARLRFSEVLPDLLSLLSLAPAATRVAAVNAIELLGDPVACRPLFNHLARSDGRHTRPIISALVACTRHQGSLLTPFLVHENPLVRVAAAESLALLATPDDGADLVAAARDDDPEVRAKIARALARIERPASLQALTGLLEDSVWYVRLQAAAALGNFRTEEVRDLLLRTARDPHWQVRVRAAEALYRLVPDPVELLQMVRDRLRDRYAVEAVVSTLEREGAIWRAIDGLAASDPAARAHLRALIEELIETGICSAVFYALEYHPRAEVRDEILDALDARAKVFLRPALEDLCGSDPLGAPARQRVRAILSRWEG